METYFATDGSYGDGDGIVVIDTIYWTDAMWTMIDECSDYDRVYIAELFEAGASVAEVEGILEKNNTSSIILLNPFLDLSNYRKENA
jgi:hypothetical protein